MTDPWNLPNELDPQRQALDYAYPGDSNSTLGDLQPLPDFPWQTTLNYDGTVQNYKLPMPSTLVRYFAEVTDFKQRFLVDKENGLCWVYGAEREGVFSIVIQELIADQVLNFVETSIAQQVRHLNNTSLYHYRVSTSKYAEELAYWCRKEATKIKGGIHDENASPKIGFRNGCLHVGIMNDDGTPLFTPHSPQYRLGSVLPHIYTAEAAQATYFHEWLDFVTYGKKGTQQVIRAFLRAAILGQAAMFQKFLFLTGQGGSGKGSLTRVFRNCVGNDNCHQTSLERLETVRFESASLLNKLLILFPDEGKYTGSVDVFKGLTGGDCLPYEIKGKQASKGFLPVGLAVVASNFNFPSGDKSGAIDRRIVRISIDRQVDKPDPSHYKKLEGCTTGIIQWALEMSQEDMVHSLSHHATVAPELAKFDQESQQDENSIYAFIDQILVRAEDLPEVFLNDKQYLCPTGFNKAKYQGFVLEESLLPMMKDPRDGSEYAVGHMGKGVQHFYDYFRLLYPCYTTYADTRGERNYNLANFKKALATNLSQKLNVRQGKLPNNTTGFPGLIIRFLLPPDLRQSVPCSISRVLPEDFN